ncbi:PaREP1 family protein [Thermofilum pendens]|uniref:PaREP8 domain containing protein n=1 Tax=Thermofilum pendens (strain DSM 2475 / Hrk 5) TaxID=368408 RepID=A1RZY7_THEPD|nr:PaREP1 family protein [Thermofilum pendens]ABL78767.1 PaREP8 domain containing protein [Thermofilum pendens Hrk 5]
MEKTVVIPRRLVEEVEKRGLSVESLVVDALSKALDLDPEVVAEARLELAAKFMEEADEYLGKGDPVQASEKLYKVAEECIKALAEGFNAPTLEKVRERGRWDTWLLGMAATDLSRILGDERVHLAWSKAYEIHVWGFHEAKYRVEDVAAARPVVKWLLDFAGEALRKARSRRE